MISAWSIALLLTYVSTSTAGLVLLKRASLLLSAEFILGFGLYGFGFLIWLALLRSIPLAIAFPLASGALVIATQMAGVYFLDETLSPLHLTGIAAVLIGLALIGISTGVEK
jgi:multidrug transporter EmrE-like cation transporter